MLIDKDIMRVMKIVMADYDHHCQLCLNTLEWLQNQDHTYDLSGGKLRSVHAKQAAAYLQSLAESAPESQKKLLLNAAAKISNAADKIAREKETINDPQYL